MTTGIVDLGQLTQGATVHSLYGVEPGRAARAQYDLDVLDNAQRPVHVTVPEHIFSISPSFFQGLFSRSVEKFGSEDGFLAHYRFDANTVVLRQVLRGVRTCLRR